MDYQDVVEAVFLRRPNRFIAHALIGASEEVIHVPNTGRCKELLIPGTRIILKPASNPQRRTKYSLIGVYKGNTLVNIDSQVPNAVVYEGLLGNRIKEVPAVLSAKREVTWGQSRFDIGFETPDHQFGFIEVKGVTLETEGVAKFPDAPTVRGTKHVRELIDVVQHGGVGILFFLVQMRPVEFFTPYGAMDENFAKAVKEAVNFGVQVIAYDAVVTPRTIDLGRRVDVRL